ncbi:hypothetical protein ABZV34_25415 [Streptomyces sp. NPDC005195]|uniref:hypothetical protein n=1 Tax=Streptomyces sp. NPDC005195 TaxID=3154561 RepID=UPI00339F8C88
MTDIERLIPLERTAEEERAKLAGLSGAEYEDQWRIWRHASDLVQAAIAEHATASGEDRSDVEQAVKKAARCADEDPCQ